MRVIIIFGSGGLLFLGLKGAELGLLDGVFLALAFLFSVGASYFSGKTRAYKEINIQLPAMMHKELRGMMDWNDAVQMPQMPPLKRGDPKLN